MIGFFNGVAIGAGGAHCVSGGRGVVADRDSDRSAAGMPGRVFWGEDGRLRGVAFDDVRVDSGTAVRAGDRDGGGQGTAGCVFGDRPDDVGGGVPVDSRGGDSAEGAGVCAGGAGAGFFAWAHPVSPYSAERDPCRAGFVYTEVSLVDWNGGVFKFPGDRGAGATKLGDHDFVGEATTLAGDVVGAGGGDGGDFRSGAGV